MVWKILSYYILCTVIVVTTQYMGDPEYNDFDFYEDLPTDRSKSFNKEYNSAAQDGFYIANDFNTKNQDRAYSGSNYAFRNVYRYTKHRIPGFDYDEFDYMRPRSVECDDRSVWTHCLCQFTCSKPDVVDCYTPCRSGCECKEDYVFDEKAQRCLLPEECSTEDYNYNY